MAGDVSRTVSINLIADSSKSANGFGQVAGAAEHSSGRMRAAFSGLGSRMAQSGMVPPALMESYEQISGILEGVTEHGKKAGAVIAGIGAGLTATGVLLTKAADQDKLAESNLRGSVEAAGGSWEDYERKLKSLQHTGEGLNFTNLQVDEGLATLTRATHDPKVAFADMGVVMEVARARHMSLSEAAMLVAKAMTGSSKAAMKLGVDVTSLKSATSALTSAEKGHDSAVAGVAKAQKNLSNIEQTLAGVRKPSLAQIQKLQAAHDALTAAQAKLAVANGKLTAAQQKMNTATAEQTGMMAKLHTEYAGPAKQAVDSLSGRFEHVGVVIEDATAKLGGKFGHALITAGPLLMGFGAVLESGVIGKVGSAAKALGSFSLSAVKMAGSFLVATGEMIVDAAVWAASMVASAAAAALPFLPVIAVVAALAFAGYELYKHWHQVWGWIKNVAKDAADWIKHHITIILGFVGLLPLAIYEVWKHWSQIWGAITGAVSAAVTAVGAGISWIVSFVEGMGKKVTGAVTGAVSWLFRSGRDIMTGLWNGIKAGWAAILGFAVNIGYDIVKAVGDLSSVLYGAGMAIINGFAQGLYDAWKPVAHWISGVGDWISNHKGPISYDKTLLTPHGRAIIDGLRHGMELSAPALYGHVGAIAGNISKAMGGGIGGMTVGVAGLGGHGASVAVGAGSAGGGVHLHFHGPVYGGPSGAKELATTVRTELLQMKGRRGITLGLA